MKKNRASLLLILFIQLICLSAQAEDYYWIGGSGDWNDIEHWSDQPGGNVNSNALVPGKDDDVYFDEYSFPDAGAEVTITSVARCMNMYWGNVTNMPTLNTDDNEAHYLAIYGGVTFNNLMVLDLDRSLYFRASTSGNVIDFGGKTFDGDIYFENNGGWRITSEINLVNNTIYFNQGSLSIEADITCGAFLSEASVSRVLYLNSSTLTLDKSGSSVLSIQSDNLTLDAGDSKIEVISSNSSFATSGDDALEFYDLVFSGDNGSLESDAIFTSFNDITFEMDGSMQGDNEMQNLIFTSGHTYAISGDGTQTVNAKFEALGECYDFIIIEGDVYGGTISAAEVDLDYLKVENINASGAAIPFVANNSYNLGGNNTNWTFIEPSSADYTWIGAGGDNKWGTKENWNAGCVPSRNNNVIIGASYTVEIDVSAECKGLDIDDSSTLEGSEDLDIYGSLAADSCTWNFSGETQFSGDNTNTISFNGSFLGLVTFYGNGSWTLNSNLSVLDILDLEEGTLTANSYTISAEQFSSTSNYIRALDISNSVFEITTGVSKAWNIQGSGLTLTSNNSEIQLLSSGAELYHNTTDGLTYGTVSFTAADGQALLTNEGMATQPHFESLEFVGNAKLTGDHQFDQLIFSQGKEYFFNAGSIQKILVADGLIAHGTCSEYITFTGDGGTAYFDCDVNSTDLYRLRIEDVNVTGGIGSLTANESIGISGYDGWIFLDDLTGSKIYWTGNVDNDWFTAGNWEGGCLPTRKDTVVFNNDKVLLTYEVNISSTSDDAECASMIWTNADLMSFSGDQPISIFADLDFSGMINANFAYSGDFYFKAVDTTAATIDAGAVSLLGDLTFMGTLQEDDTWSAGSWTLQSELNTEGTIKLEYGDLISNDQNMEASSFVSNFDVDQPRSLSLGSSTFTLESFKVTPESFTFDAGTSEIIFDTAGELIVTKGSDPLDFYNVSVTEADGNAYIDIYSDDITFNNLVLSGNTYFRMTNDSEISFTANSIEMAIGKTYEFQSGQTFVFTDIIANGACEGSIDITGSDSDPAIFQANTGVTEITVSSVNLLNISAEPDGIFVANESIDLGGNDGWTFENEPDGDDLYWIGGTGYWDDPNHWATTSGAAVADGCVPTVKDNVFFDDGSFDDTEQTVYTGASDIRCRSMNWTGSEGNRPNFEMGDTDITGVYIYGSLILNSTMEIDLSAMVDFYFRATEAQVIESFGYVFPNIVEFDGSGGEWTLQDSLVVEGDVYIRNGKLISDGNDIECKSLTSNDETVGESTRGLDIQNSNLTINGTEDELGFSLNIKLTDPYYDQGFDLLAEGSNITFSDAASVYLAGIKNQTIEFDTITFLQDGSISTFNNLATFFPYVGYLSFNQNGVVSGHYQFGTVELGRGYDFEFKAGNIYEMDYFLAEGSCFAPISIHSSEDGTQTTISSANDVNGEFLELQDIAGDVSGGTTYTATNSFEMPNVDGWNVDGEIAPISLYWVGKGDDDSWNNYENWSRAEDGSEEGCVPTLNDDVFFTSNSFLGSKYVELLADGKCHSMTWYDDVDPEASFSVYATLQMGGSMDLTENMSLSMSGTFEFVGDGLTDDKEVDFADKSMNGDIIFDGDDQSWIWTSGLTTTGDLYLESGSVSTEGNDFTIGRFSSLSLDDYEAVRKFDMSGSIVSVTSDETTGWNMIVNTAGGLDFIATDTGITFENGGGIYCTTDTEVSFGFIDFMDNGVININGDGDGSGNFGSVAFHEQGQIFGDNTFTNLEFTLGYDGNTIESGKTITVINDLTMEGVRCSYVFLRASEAGEVAYIYKPSGYFEDIYDASFTDIVGSSGSGGEHPVYYYYENNNSTGFYEQEDTDEDGDGELEENAPSFESIADSREEYCSDEAYLDFVEYFPINSNTTFIWYYSEDGSDGSYSAIEGETSTTITVDTSGFYKVAVIYGDDSDGSGDICEIESVIEVILGAVSNVTLNITSTNVSCYGFGDGLIIAQVDSTMYPDYSFIWKDEDGTSVASTTYATDGKSTASNLDPGKYYITVTDSKTCEFDTTVNIFDAYELLVDSIVTKDLTCYTSPEGEILLSASGGTGTLSYFLNDDVQASSNITGLNSGNYAVYVQDENACTTDVDTIEISSNPEIVLELNGSDLLCYGDSNGEFAPTVTGGVPDYTYSWTGPDSYTSTSASISGLAGGSYELTVTDAVNCSSALDTVLLEPEKLTTSELTVDDVDCNGESSGEIYVVGTQGTPDYTYSVDGLESDSGIFTDLDPGDYTVQIVDANACVYDTLVTVGEPSVIGFLIEDVVLPTCENTNDGIIQITPYGGNSGYTFSWSGPDDYRSYSQNLENLAAGDYTLLINDIENCSGEGEVDLSLGYTIQLGLIVEQDVTTSGGSDGILTVETSEGTTPYSFTISGPDGYSYSSPSGYDNSSSTIENLAAGVYTVVATDVSGCSTVEKSTIIDEPGAIFAYIEEIQSVGCSTNNVGELKAHASGSTGSYTYSWSSTSGYTGSGQIITGLSEGTYILTVTSGSETATDTYELVAPDALTVSVASVVNVTCNNEANGEIELDVDAGSADYSIEWTSDNGFYSTAEHILDLEPGTYDYTVTTEYGCSVSGSETISEPTLLELSVTTDNYSGAGTGDGKLSASVTGGTPPYTFLVYGPSDFSKSDTNTSGTYSLSGLLKGYYEVFVLDANECRVESSDKVYETDILVLFTSSITSVTCPGGSDGAISVDVLGESDSTNISYSWTGDNYFTSTEKDISGLKAGDYTVTVYDSEGDAGYESQSLEITVSEPDELVPEYWKKDITCYGLDDGYINLHPQGGTPSYTYSWTGTGVVATNEDQQGLSEGTYTIQITDSNGCVSETESITIEEPSQVTVSISDYSEPTCYGLEDGWITVDISDGSGPYLINWDDYGSISEDIYDLEAGDYSIVVTDKNGCETVDTLVLNQPDSLIAEINDYDDVSCYNLKTGRAIVDISGGTPSYTISWSDGQNTDEAYNLGTGRYEVTVVDEHACSDTSSVEITQPEAIVLKVNATRPTTIDAYDGSIRIDVSGGVEDYNINWLDVDGIYYGSGLSIEDLDADTYKVHVLDANSCRRDSTIVLDYLYETQIKIPKAFTPNGDGYNDYWDLERIEYVQDLKIIIYDRWGKEVYNFSGTGNEYRGNPWTGEDGNSDAAIGSYYYAVILNDEKPLMGTVTILR